MNIKELKKKYPILTGVNNPILRAKNKSVQVIDDEIRYFAAALVELMFEYDGVGLAAPQLGYNIGMCAITQWKFKKNDADLILEDIMINPKIIKKSDKMIEGEEGCLSVPNIQGNVLRYEKVVVEYTNIQGKYRKLHAEGENARILQHEIDHLDGVLFVDKIQKGGLDLGNIVSFSTN